MKPDDPEMSSQAKAKKAEKDRTDARYAEIVAAVVKMLQEVSAR